MEIIRLSNKTNSNSIFYPFFIFIRCNNNIPRLTRQKPMLITEIATMGN